MGSVWPLAAVADIYKNAFKYFKKMKWEVDFPFLSFSLSFGFVKKIQIGKTKSEAVSKRERERKKSITLDYSSSAKSVFVPSKVQ